MNVSVYFNRFSANPTHRSLFGICSCCYLHALRDFCVIPAGFLHAAYSLLLLCDLARMQKSRKAFKQQEQILNRDQ